MPIVPKKKCIKSSDSDCCHPKDCKVPVYTLACCDPPLPPLCFACPGESCALLVSKRVVAASPPSLVRELLPALCHCCEELTDFPAVFYDFEIVIVNRGENPIKVIEVNDSIVAGGICSVWDVKNVVVTYRNAENGSSLVSDLTDVTSPVGNLIEGVVLNPGAVPVEEQVLQPCDSLTIRLFVTGTISALSFVVLKQSVQVIAEDTVTMEPLHNSAAVAIPL